MSLFSTSACRHALALLALVGVACASSAGDAASPDADSGVDCAELATCGDKLQCSGGAQCFRLKSCDAFVCASVEVACRSQCGSKKCLVLESQPMMLSCR